MLKGRRSLVAGRRNAGLGVVEATRPANRPLAGAGRAGQGPSWQPRQGSSRPAGCRRIRQETTARAWRVAATGVMGLAGGLARRRRRRRRPPLSPSRSSVVICEMRGFGLMLVRPGMPPQEAEVRKRYVVVLSEQERARLHTMIGRGVAPASAL